MKHSAILAAALLAVSAPSFAAPSGVPEGRWRITGVDGKSASGTLVFDHASSRLSGALSAVRRYRLRETPAGAELVLADKYGKVRILAVKEAKDAPPAAETAE